MYCAILKLIVLTVNCVNCVDSCVRRRHSGAILRHFYSLLLTELR